MCSLRVDLIINSSKLNANTPLVIANDSATVMVWLVFRHSFRLKNNYYMVWKRTGLLFNKTGW